jgi:hypothetical protein
MLYQGVSVIINCCNHLFSLIVGNNHWKVPIKQFISIIQMQKHIIVVLQHSFICTNFDRPFQLYNAPFDLNQHQWYRFTKFAYLITVINRISTYYSITKPNLIVLSICQKSKMKRKCECMVECCAVLAAMMSRIQQSNTTGL